MMSFSVGNVVNTIKSFNQNQNQNTMPQSNADVEGAINRTRDAENRKMFYQAQLAEINAQSALSHSIFQTINKINDKIAQSR